MNQRVLKRNSVKVKGKVFLAKDETQQKINKKFHEDKSVNITESFKEDQNNKEKSGKESNSKESKEKKEEMVKKKKLKEQYNKGYEEGFKKAKKELEKEFKQKEEEIREEVNKREKELLEFETTIENWLEHMDKEKKSYIKDLGKTIFEINTVLFEKFVSKIAENDERVIKNTIDQIFDKIESEEKFELKVNSQDYNEINDSNTDIFEKYRKGFNFNITTDNTIKRGSAKAIFENNVIDATLKSRYKVIEDYFKELYKAEEF